MRHFGTGVLLFLAVGALAAPAKSAPKPAPKVSNNSNNNIGAAESPAPMVEESPKVEATSAGGETSQPVLSAASSAVSAFLDTTTTMLSSSSSSKDATGTLSTTVPASTAAFSAAPLPPVGFTCRNFSGTTSNLISPIWLRAIAAGLNADNNKTLTSISTVLLALTKVQSEGEWIKSLFDLPGDKGAVYEGPDIVNITLYDVGKNVYDNNPEFGTKKSMKIEKGNLRRLTELGVDSSQIKDTEPWWPWALIEGVLEIESAFKDKGYIAFDVTGYQLRLKILTGNEQTKEMYIEEPDPLDDKYVSEVIKNADMSPVIFERVPGSWAVMMRGPHKNAKGEDQIGWAGPFPTPENDHVEEFISYTTLTDRLGAGSIVYVKDPKPFTGRPENLRL